MPVTAQRLDGDNKLSSDDAPFLAMPIALDSSRELLTWSRLLFVATPGDDLDIAHRITLQVSMLGEYAVEAVLVEPPTPHAAIGSPVRMPLARILHVGALAAAFNADGTAAQLPPRVRPRGRVKDETLNAVAMVYNVAQPGGAPTRAVSDWFDLEHRTAGRWVARCREAGLIQEWSN